MNQEEHYPEYVQTLLNQFEVAQKAGRLSIDYQRVQKYENFTQIFVISTSENEDVELKIDVVNDVALHYGGFEQHATLGRLDSWQNILSNKLTAIFRFEAKDIADIWMIAKYRAFHWMSIMEEAKTKEAGIDPVVLFDLFRSFPEDALSTIKWAIPVEPGVFKRELEQIADDILRGSDNTLAA
jgi:hypothetical protein